MNKQTNTDTNQESNDLLNQLKEREEVQLEEFKKSIAATISETFKNWKEREKSITQTTFAKIIGCSQPRVSNIINGNVEQFTVDKLLGFCTHLGINPILQTKPLKNLKSDTRELLERINEDVA